MANGLTLSVIFEWVILAALSAMDDILATGCVLLHVTNQSMQHVANLRQCDALHTLHPTARVGFSGPLKTAPLCVSTTVFIHSREGTT